ncbi:carboxypeptidase M32 [Staphylospora marina]|uniref:carboxypeptidase M32 n=1 Tax=Staphylospora marina TaxID=2490858 RepID=UPI000F5BF3A2|nr:carboxypeptidase M32 [Staphylospora marina]
MEKKMEELRARLREIQDLHSAVSILSWDQNTYMPPAGAEARGQQMATLGRLAHEKLTDPALGRLLEELREAEQSASPDDDDAALIRLTRREYEKAVRVPADFVSRFYAHSAKTHQAWVEARESDDFSKVAPYLEKTLEFSREYSSFFPEAKHVADPHIDRSDYGMKTETIRRLFGQLRDRLVPLVEEVTSRPALSNACLLQSFPVDKQLEFCRFLIKELGYDFNRGRLDLSPHPFMIKFAHNDVRITTRAKEHDLSEALFSTIHETGHALYELGIDPAYEGTPLSDGTSSGVHESQSRLWENVVGRSRAFWTHYYPKLQETFPSQLGNVTLDEFYRAINRVERSLIRTDADELTYNLHVIIRFDLELELLEGKLSVRDLPEAWRERYRSDLGTLPPDDKNGVLQDIHWYADYIGGMFQGYTLGNIMSVQFFDAAVKDHPDIPERIRQGDVSLLHEWLKDRVYRHGSKYTAEEIIRRATGSDLTIEPYINYLTSKYRELIS